MSCTGLCLRWRMYIKSQVLTIHLNKLNILGKADSFFKFQVIGLIYLFQIKYVFPGCYQNSSSGRKTTFLHATISGGSVVVGQLLCVVGYNPTQSREYIITEFFISFLRELLLKRQFKPIWEIILRNFLIWFQPTYEDGLNLIWRN